jgi:formylmethanofuran dehydrogenase subunit E
MSPVGFIILIKERHPSLIMQFSCHPRAFTELRVSMEAYGITPTLQDHFTRCISFHTITAPGLFIGVFMVDYALELLDAQQGEKLYAVTETYKCIPDPVQVIAGCTFGNHRLQVLPIGKFALTMNRPSEKEVVEGVRVYVDIKKLKKFRIINAWYTHSPGFDSSEMIYPLIDQILVAGRDILSCQRVIVKVPGKESWKSVPCSSCGEMVPDVTLEEGNCRGCGSMTYYTVIQ